MVEINKFYNLNIAKGEINLISDLEGNILKNDKFYNTFKGNTIITSKELVIKNLNLSSLRKNISEIKSLENINEVRKNLFNGNTNIKDQKIKLIHKEGLIKIPLTKIKIAQDYITTSGEYAIEQKKINLSSNYESDNSLLTLFTLNTSGKVSDPLTKLSFNENAVSKILEKLTKKRIKKVLEKKLEDKFDNIIENLLE